MENFVKRIKYFPDNQSWGLSFKIIDKYTIAMSFLPDKSDHEKNFTFYYNMELEAYGLRSLKKAFMFCLKEDKQIDFDQKQKKFSGKRSLYISNFTVQPYEDICSELEDIVMLFKSIHTYPLYLNDNKSVLVCQEPFFGNTFKDLKDITSNIGNWSKDQ